jgi:hypothetical protein
MEIKEGSAGNTVRINNPQASEWDKMATLKQLEVIRETKKQNLLERVLKESIACRQTIEVVTGQASLVSFLVSNPFPQDAVFHIEIAGDEQQELHLVHNEGNREWLFWHNQGRCPKPAGGWDSVSNKGEVLLRSG